MRVTVQPEARFGASLSAGEAVSFSPGLLLFSRVSNMKRSLSLGRIAFGLFCFAGLAAVALVAREERTPADQMSEAAEQFLRNFRPSNARRPTSISMTRIAPAGSSRRSKTRNTWPRARACALRN